MSTANAISISGGKDSLASALVAIERETSNLFYLFADTGHEHASTYDYIDYLEEALGVTIERLKADFSREISRKREYIKNHWADKGVPASNIERALSVLRPTGIPFLDLCLWKGRFPSTRRRFCSESLKHHPLNARTDELLAEYDEVYSWQGIRRDESIARSKMLEEEDHPTKQGLVWYRPIVTWTAEDCFDIAKRHGIKPNPLYLEGMGRVGCMPCIHSTKGEVMEIARRFPAELERLAEWERLVSEASKRGASTFLMREWCSDTLG